MWSYNSLAHRLDLNTPEGRDDAGVAPGLREHSLMYQRLGHSPWGFQEDDLGLNLHSAGYEPVISTPFPPLTAGTRQQPGTAGMTPFTKMTCKMSSLVAGTGAGLQACGLRFVCGAQRGQRLPGHKASGSPASPGLQGLTQGGREAFPAFSLDPYLPRQVT